MRFGNQTVYVVSVTEDLTGPRDEFGHPPTIRTETAVTGCRCRPLPATEDTTDSGDKVTDPWKLTAPPAPAIVGAMSGDEIRVGDTVFSVTGLPRVFTDRAGRDHHVVILLSRNLG
jgi:hypothetical protein